MRRLLRLLKRSLSPDGDLTSRTVVSGLWVAFTNGGNRVLETVMLVVMARLLSPADFGLFGIAMIALSAFKRFSRLGLDTALIQRKDENVDAYLDTAFTLQILRGIAIAAVAYLSAPFVAPFFDEPQAELLLRVLAIATLFETLYNPGRVYFEKDLAFHKQFVFSLSGTLPRVVVSIGYALFVEATVWALAVGFIAGNVVRMLTSYAIHDYRPWPRFNRTYAGEIIGYGKWILGSSMVSFLYSEGDDIFVGRVLGSGALGAYQLAYQLSNAPATEISHTISRVAMPAYSKVQDDTAALREGFYRVLRLSSLVSLPVGVGIAVVAPVFVPVFLGDGWEAMIVPMQILAGFGLLRSVRTCTSPLFNAVGRPDYGAKLHALRLAVLAVAIYPLTTAFGLPGTSLAVLVTSAVGLPVAAWLALRIVDDDLRSLAAPIVFPAFGSVVMGGCALFARRAVTETAGMFVGFVATVLTGVVVYALVMFALEQRFDIGLNDLVGQVRGSL
ncbi:lipopolysaccharide biosynthesis protein [Halomarina ordinaria]|uniref:Lipopolysaccharide biosynthesis protein n=1 Tax=Halomarina ordinaria TaxID=3033939 RepID=A0ABD5U8P0_9EURY|nr:lipopolysaccharide biosynthesis protein [Halomarina sp. PSRA2]